MTATRLGPPFMKRREVAALFNVNPSTVDRWAETGRIPSMVTPGGQRRYRRAEIVAFAADNGWLTPAEA